MPPSKRFSRSSVQFSSLSAVSSSPSTIRALSPCPPRLPFPSRPPAPDPPDPLAESVVPVVHASSPTLSDFIFSPPSLSPTADVSDDSDTEGQLVDDHSHMGLANESSARQYTCNVGNCRKAFARKSDLARHHRIHTNDRPFACTFPRCGKAFIQRSALTVHHRTHTGERPHSCECCDKRFADSSSLARHRRTHTGKRPYSCRVPICNNKSFARRNTFMKHYKRTHPELPLPTSSLPRTRSAAPPFLSAGALSTEGHVYLATPSTTGPPHGFAAPHPPEGAAHPSNGGHTGQIFGGASGLHASGFAFPGTGLYRTHSHSTAPVSSLLTPLSASTTASSHFAEAQQQADSPSAPGAGGGSGGLSRRQHAQQAYQGEESAFSHLSAGPGPYPNGVGSAQYSGYHPTSYPLTRFASDSGPLMYADRSNLPTGPRSVSSPMDQPLPRWQSYLPSWGNVGGGFHASQLSLPQQSSHLAPSYYNPSIYAQRSLSGRPLINPVSPNSQLSNPDDQDDPLVSIGDAPSFTVHPPPGQAMAYPMSAVSNSMYSVDLNSQSQVLYAPMQYDRLHSAPPALHRFNSLPSIPTVATSSAPQEEPHTARSADAGKSVEEDWDNLLSREASVGEDTQLPLAATRELMPPNHDENTGHWDPPMVYPAPPVRDNYRYPFSSSASTSSTSSTLVGASTFTGDPSNTLPPISAWAQNPLPMALHPINTNGFFPTPATPASGWTGDHIKPTHLLGSPALLTKPYHQMQSHDTEQEDDRSQVHHDITLITPPNKWQLDAHKESKVVATVGLGISNVHFTDRSDNVAPLKGDAVAVQDREWQEGEEELESEPEPDDDSDDDYVVGRKPKKTKKTGSRRGAKFSVAGRWKRR